MSRLVLLLPAKPRLHPLRDAQSSPAASVAEVDYALAAERRGIKDAGRAAPALLPVRSATEVVAILPDHAVSWHRITLPKAPPSRMRSALVGVLEEALLEEPEGMHFAVEPEAEPGKDTWIASTDKAWLTAQLEALDAAGVLVDRVVPLSWPSQHVLLHFEAALEGGEVGETPSPEDSGVRLTWAHEDGVAKMPVRADGSAAVSIGDVPEGARVHATPAAAVVAERWAQRPVTVVRAAERWLWAARSDWNMRQFDLAPSRRGTAQMRKAWAAFLGPSWRPVRWGLAALVLVQIIGLNMAAWRQRSEMAQVRQAMTALLRSSFPQVTAILDAPVQMQRETEALRAMAGQPGEGDLEPLLQSVASVWPVGQSLQGMRYESGQLTLATNGLPPNELTRIDQALRAGGMHTEVAEGRLTLRPARQVGGAPR